MPERDHSRSGVNSPMYGKKHSEETKEKMSQARKGIQYSSETINNMKEAAKKRWEDPEYRAKMSAIHKGRKLTQEWKDNVSKAGIGRKHSEETKRIIGEKNRINMTRKTPSKETRKKQSIAAIEHMKKSGRNGLEPNWNPKACDYFEQFDRNHNTSGKHARNGGEYNIPDTQFFVDYINHDLKLIIEYDEDYHYSDDKNLRSKDIIRQKTIEMKMPEYEFIRIKDGI